MSIRTFFYLGGFELPDRNAAALRVLSNAKILRGLGFRVVLVGVRKDGGDGLVKSCAEVDGFECWSVRYPGTLKEWAAHLSGSTPAIRLLQSKLACAAGVICYNYPAIALMRVLRLCRKNGVLCIADITEWYDSSGGGLVFRLVKGIDTWLRIRAVGPACDGVITTSRWMTKRYDRGSIPVVELPSLFDKEAQPLKNSPLTGQSRRRLVYVGMPFNVGRVNSSRSNLKDRLDLSIELLHDLYNEGFDYSFDVYGITKSDYLTVFPEHAVKLRELGARVTFHGSVPNSVARTAIAESDFSVFFRDQTRVTLAGFPTKLSESISLGTPVVSNLHANVQRYATFPALLLAAPGSERAQLRRALSMTSAEVEELKLICSQSQVFDYRSFLPEFDTFLKKMRLES